MIGVQLRAYMIETGLIAPGGGGSSGGGARGAQQHAWEWQRRAHEEGARYEGEEEEEYYQEEEEAEAEHGAAAAPSPRPAAKRHLQDACGDSEGDWAPSRTASPVLATPRAAGAAARPPAHGPIAGLPWIPAPAADGAKRLRPAGLSLHEAAASSSRFEGSPAPSSGVDTPLSLRHGTPSSATLNGSDGGASTATMMPPPPHPHPHGAFAHERQSGLMGLPMDAAAIAAAVASMGASLLGPGGILDPHALAGLPLFTQQPRQPPQQHEHAMLAQAAFRQAVAAQQQQMQQQMQHAAAAAAQQQQMQQASSAAAHGKPGLQIQRPASPSDDEDECVSEAQVAELMLMLKSGTPRGTQGGVAL